MIIKYFNIYFQERLTAAEAMQQPYFDPVRDVIKKEMEEKKAKS